MHVDHVGSDTHRVDGRWVPDLSAGPPPLHRAELSWSQAETNVDKVRIHEDSVGPVFTAASPTS
jgi:hypothetical protein